MARLRNSAAWQAWRERLRRFQAADETVAEFCGREEVSVGSFYQWQRKLRQEQHGQRDDGDVPVRLSGTHGGSGRSSPARFVELTLRGTPAGKNSAGVTVGVAETRIEVHLPNGARVLVGSQDLAVLRAAIHAAAETSPTAGPGATPC